MADLYIPTDLQATADEIDIRLLPDPSSPQIESGTIASVDTSTGRCTVAMASGTSITNVPWNQAYTPTVSEVVWLLRLDKVMWILGAPFNPSGSGGLTGLYGWTRAATAPGGWVFANGGAIPAAYTGLIALCGANTPDLRDRSIIGAGVTYTLGTDYGAATSTALLAHGHTASGSHAHSIGSGSNVSATGAVRQEPGSSGTATSSSDGSGVTIGTAGAGSSFSLLHPVHGANPLIHA